MDAPVAEKEFLTQLKVLNQKINFMKEQTFKGLLVFLLPLVRS